MFTGIRKVLLTGGFMLLASCAAWAQTTTLEGDVKGEDGQPVKGAVIQLTRTDIKGHYSVKSDKKGHWLYTGLPYGKYDIECQIDGKTVDKVGGVQSSYGESKTVDFDLQKAKTQQAAVQQANGTGQLTEQQSKAMSKEEKEKAEETLKKNAEINKKNKALNDAFNAAQDAMKAGAAEPDPTKKIADYQTAVDSLNKAATVDGISPGNQAIVYYSMGKSYSNMGDVQKGDDRTKSYDQAIDAYKKSLAIKEDADIYNNLGNLYGAEKKYPEASDALNKAATLDPTKAGKAYYNMGANLVNGGQTQQATEYFKKATVADPNYAEAWYQYGNGLFSLGTVDVKTGAQKFPEDTAPALQKYLELAPNGPNAETAKAYLQAMGQTVQTTVTVPKKKK